MHHVSINNQQLTISNLTIMAMDHGLWTKRIIMPLFSSLYGNSPYKIAAFNQKEDIYEQ